VETPRSLLQRAYSGLREQHNLPVDTILNNVKILTDKGLITVGIAINRDRIVKIAKKTNLPQASRQIDLKGNVALPGLVDSHVHLRDQDMAYREDFTSGTMAAAAGGVTTVVDMPNNSPTTMSVETLRNRMQLARNHVMVNVAFNSALPTHLNEIPRIIEAGAIGFKLYLIQQIGGIKIDDDDALRSAFKAVCKTGAPIAVHAEDRLMIERTQASLMEQGRNSIAAFLQAHQPEAEEKAVIRAVDLATKVGAKLHFCHISSEQAMRAITRTKKLGLNVTCEVTPHHLLLTSNHLRKYGKLALEIPPLRRHSDVAYLWQKLRQGLIDTIASDHAPHSRKEKEAESIWDVKPGIVGLETILPLLFTQIHKGRLTLEQLVRLTCRKPAEIYCLKDRGTLTTGSFADIAIINLNKECRIDASRFYSKAKFSPFDGWKAKGAPIKTFVNGQLVMDEGRIVAKPGCGRVT
jgi:dihydroorotase (multifunctional complex type)